VNSRRAAQVLNIPDVTQDPRFPGSQDRPTQLLVGVSLVSKGNLAGLLVLEKAEVGYYTPAMEQLALTFANQVAISSGTPDSSRKPPKLLRKIRGFTRKRHCALVNSISRRNVWRCSTVCRMR
jgi:hypothetical protein